MPLTVSRAKPKDLQYYNHENKVTFNIDGHSIINNLFKTSRQQFNAECIVFI